MTPGLFIDYRMTTDLHYLQTGLREFNAMAMVFRKICRLAYTTIFTGHWWPAYFITKSKQDTVKDNHHRPLLMETHYARFVITPFIITGDYSSIINQQLPNSSLSKFVVRLTITTT